MQKKVYVVWRSHYEEDGILGIFSTTEKAEEYLSHAANADEDAFIEDFDLDEEPNKSAKVYHVFERFRDGVSCGVRVRVNKISDETIPLSTVEYGFDYKEYKVFAVRKEEAIEIAKRKDEYIKEHPEKYPLLGKYCLFRFEKVILFPEFQGRFPVYDIDSGNMIMPAGAIEFLGLAKKQ